MLPLKIDFATDASWNAMRRPLCLLTALTGFAGVFLFSAHMSQALPPAPTVSPAPIVSAAPLVFSKPLLLPKPRLTAHEANVLGRKAANRLHFQVRLTRQQAAHQARLAKATAHLVKVQAQNHALSSGNVVAAAYAFRGTRYVMGGTSRSGFDCSGFVRYILGATGGVELPRTALEQYYNGAAIPSDQLQPGDLVFFKNTYKRGISHVGIYAGEGKFIHAANAHKGVRMDNLGDHYYQAHYAGARRVLPENMRTAASL